MNANLTEWRGNMIIGKVDPVLKSRIDRVQAHIRLLVERYERIPEDVWDALTRKLYELVERV